MKFTNKNGGIPAISKSLGSINSRDSPAPTVNAATKSAITAKKVPTDWNLSV
jgi:hypothetical protein